MEICLEKKNTSRSQTLSRGVETRQNWSNWLCTTLGKVLELAAEITSFRLTFLNCCCCAFTSIFTTSRRTGYCISREKCSAKLSNWDKYDSHGCNLQALGTVINQRRPLGSGWELNFTSRRKIEIYYFCIRPVRLLWISLNLAGFSLLHLPLHSFLFFILLTCKKSVYLAIFFLWFRKIHEKSQHSRIRAIEPLDSNRTEIKLQPTNRSRWREKKINSQQKTAVKQANTWMKLTS